MSDAANTAAEAVRDAYNRIAFNLANVHQLAAVILNEDLPGGDSAYACARGIEKIIEAIGEEMEDAIKEAAAPGACETGSAQPPADAPNAAPEPDAQASEACAAALLKGRTPGQIQHILEMIATSANVLRRFAHNNGEDPSGDDMYMCAMIAERIGELADFGGAGCVGGTREWVLGPNFATD